MEKVPSANTPLLSRPYIKFGLAGGVIAALFNYAYIFNERLFLVTEWGLAPIPIIVILALYAGIAQRKKQGGLMRYDTAVSTIFGAMLVAILTSTVLNALLFFVFDPQLPQHFADMIRRLRLEQLQSGKLNKPEYDNFLREGRNVSPGKLLVLQMFGVMLLETCFGLILALILSIFLKKEIKE